MRRAKADYDAVQAALEPRQLTTLREYAAVDSAAGGELWSNSVCCAVAIALVVRRRLQEWSARGVSERHAIARIAAEFNLDVETLVRHRRRRRWRSSPAK